MPTLLSINGQPISFGGAVLSWPDAGADVTAPTLAFSTLTATGATTATGTVTTYEAGGTVYAYISTSGTPPIAATVKANGTSQAGGSAGVKTFNFTGLTPETLYSVYYVQTDAAGNDSDVANAADTTDVEELPAGFAYIWPTVTVESAPETTNGYRWKVRAPIGSGAYTTVKTVTPSVAIGTELAATTYHETYNAQFDGIVVAYNGDGESTSTYDPIQFWTAPSADAPVLTATAVSAMQIDLAWAYTPNPANGGFIIIRGGTEIARVDADVRYYEDTGRTAETEYGYTVRPYNENPDILGAARADSLGTISNTAIATTDVSPYFWRYDFDGGEGDYSDWTVVADPNAYVDFADSELVHSGNSLGLRRYTAADVTVTPPSFAAADEFDLFFGYKFDGGFGILPVIGNLAPWLEGYSALKSIVIRQSYSTILGTSAETAPSGAVIYFWMHYKRSTGASDGELSIIASSTTTKPVADSGNSVTVNHNQTEASPVVYLYKVPDVTYQLFDKIRGSYSGIGSNPD